MDAMVTARVPVEVKEQVNALLREAGSSPTELVNAAYDYYLHCGELPQVFCDTAPVRITLTSDQVDQLRERLSRCTCAVCDDYWQRAYPIGG